MSSNFCLPRRGLKACPSCGHIQGQRKLICANESCELRKKLLDAQIPYDPVKLVTKNSATIFSLRTKERDAHPRNFAEITDVTLCVEQNSTIVSRNALCYVESCKYATNSEGLCKHIKACNIETNQSKAIPNADVYTLSREVLWNLNIDAKQKERLWQLYNEDENIVPAVQRLNATYFAVKCSKSKSFPAGRLHVAINNINRNTTKKPIYACACKKLKIILEPDNSVVMQDEICDHLLLVLGAILSKPNGKNLYRNFTNSLKSFWMPTELEKPIGQLQEDAFFGLDINIGDIVDDAADDIFIFDDKFLTNDTLPDLTDIIFDLTPADLMTNTLRTNQNSVTNAQSDTSYFSNSNINKQHDIFLNDIIPTTTTTTDTATTMITAPTIEANEINSDVAATTQLELSDCNIELMDQFQLTDRIDLDLETTAGPTIFDNTNGISVLSAPPAVAPITISLPEITDSLPIYEQNNNTQVKDMALTNVSGNSLFKSNHNILPIEAPPIELPTIAVVKKTPLKATQIVSEIKTRRFPPIPAKRTLIINNADKNLTESSTDLVDINAEPSLSYSAWLEHIIEMINDSVEIVEETDITHTFHVHEEIFSHFSKSFSIGVKRRMPNSTKVLKTGKYKGLIKYVWYFPSSATVRRIFSTKNLSLQIERAFEKTNEGDFIPFVRQPIVEANGDAKRRRLYPKLALYVAHIWFDCKDEDHMTGFKLEWLPNTFPKSHFGILTIAFSLGIKDPNMLGVTI